MQYLALTLVSISCADDRKCPFTPEDMQMQNRLVSNLFCDADGAPLSAAFNYLINPTARDQADVCQWYGIGCDARGAMQSLVVINGFLGGSGSVDVRWLPPTLQFVRISHVPIFLDLASSDMPRDTRYLYIALNEPFRGDKIDFRRLPEKMEELILSPVILRGPIFIAALPKTMHMVHMYAKKLTGTVFVDTAPLPDELEGFYISRNAPKQDDPYRSIDKRRQVDSRMRFGRGRTEIDKSRYDEEMYEKS